ncbi:MAG: DUF1573 domain-containing protein [Verrucomicrobia bacterium]|nr:DUF1573 domain-containing protein [Verrucomicrobiota bacterium]
MHPRLDGGGEIALRSPSYMIKRHQALQATAAALVLAATTTAVPVAAQLSWLNAEQSFTTKPADTQVLTTYAFTNLGSYVVTVQGVKASCGCTTAKLDKKTYEPGEGGVINTTFTIGNRRGTQTKRITVTTDDPPKSNKSLLLKVEIPRVVVVKPQLVSWNVGEAHARRTIEISAAEGATVELVEALPSTEGVVAETKVLKEQGQYEISLTPVSTDAPFRGFITLKVKINGDAIKEYRVFYRALPAMPPPTAPAAGAVPPA